MKYTVQQHCNTYCSRMFVKCPIQCLLNIQFGSPVKLTYIAVALRDSVWLLIQSLVIGLFRFLESVLFICSVLGICPFFFPGLSHLLAYSFCIILLCSFSTSNKDAASDVSFSVLGLVF